MSESTKSWLAWGAVLLLVQWMLAGVGVPVLTQLVEQGRRATSEAVLGGVGLIALGLIVITAVLGAHRRAQASTRHS